MTNKQKYGLKLSGIVRVFRKDKEIQGKSKKKFTITDVWFNVSEREDGGGWFNKSVNLIFPRDIDPPENNTIIEIIEAFPMITGTGDYRKIVYYVKGWHYAESNDK